MLPHRTIRVTLPCNVKPNADVLRLPHENSKGHCNHLIVVRPCRDHKVFKRHANLWVETIVQTCSKCGEMDTRSVLLQMMKILAEMDVTVLDEVSVRMGNVLKKRKTKLLAVEMMAMTDDANLTLTQVRKMRKHLTQAGLNLFLPEAAIRTLNEEYMLPTIKRYRVGLTNKLAWHIHIADQVMRYLNSLAKKLMKHIDKLKEVHLNILADHGQGAFRFVVRVLVFVKPGTEDALGLERFHPLCDEVFLTGWVECKKDTREVLEASALTELNDSLQSPGESEAVTLFNGAEGTASVRWGNDTTTDVTVVHNIPFFMFLLGDTAFISTILGRDGFSPSWCNICWFKKAEWQIRGELGTPVTLDAIIERVNKLKAGSLNPKDVDDVKGCKELPLLTWQKPERTLVGVLHCVDLLGNTVMKNMSSWIHWRIEAVPQEITDCQQALAAAMLAQEENQHNFDTCNYILESSVVEQGQMELVKAKDRNKDEKNS